MTDFFDKLYSCRSGNRFLNQIKFFSALRLITRLAANIILPVYYRLSNGYAITDEDGMIDNRRIIISITSFPNRINRIWLVIESLFRQTQKPHKIILWLSKEQFDSINSLPERLVAQQKKGLEIRLCDGDLKAHKKYFYAFQEFPNEIVVTFDDDVFYSTKILSELIKIHIRFPHSICCNAAHRITVQDGEIAPYTRWSGNVKRYEPGFDIFFIGVGGVLYPPGSLVNDVFNIHVFEKVCINADDIWLKTMSLLKGTKVVRTDYFSNYLPVLHFKNKSLSTANIYLNKNDQQLEAVRNYFIYNSGIDPFFKIIERQELTLV